MLTAEFDGQTVRHWHVDPGGGVRVEREQFHPTVYVASDRDLGSLADALTGDPKVRETAFERWRTNLHDREPQRVLGVTLDRAADVRPFAREVKHTHERGDHPPGTYRLYNVDLTPGFRYCLATGREPTPSRSLRTTRLSLPERSLVDGALEGLRLDGERLDGTDQRKRESLREHLASHDPDVLVLSSGDLVPHLAGDGAANSGSADDTTGANGVDLGREPGYECLAGANVYHSYGQAGYSPARYDVPGRVLIDRSNSFLWGESSLDGMLDLVQLSGRPLQELSWASIGTVLTAIEIREALDRGVLVPWNKWEPEAFKSPSRLYDADRGGFIFAPEVGLHEDVHELDFASLYPSIIREYNVSPETVDCDCHDRADVPEVGYSVCDRSGFLPDVLDPLLDRRAELKRQIDAADDPERVAALESRSGALKWILVASFGYQGYRNAKFGRIECHEAINAYAREIALQAKQRLEAGGWRVLHGIVDSLWVTPARSDPEPLERIVADISASVGIDLERDGRYEWVAFPPKRDAPGGALTRYVGKRADGEYKLRGIEARQRSTPPFVAERQRELVQRFDETRDPSAVCDHLQGTLATLRRGDVDPEELVLTTRLSKSPAAYQQATRTEAALRRCRQLDRTRHPGQSVRYVVIDDSARQPERVRLAEEEPDSYDTEFYASLLLRAAASVLSAVGWDLDRIDRYLRETVDACLDAFGG